MEKRHLNGSIILIVLGIWVCTMHGMKTQNVAASDIPLNTGVRDISYLTHMEKETIMELNTARTDPKQYTDFLKSLKGSPQWSQGLDEAVLFIEQKRPLPPLRVSKGLSLAARALVIDRGPEGLTGHITRDERSMLDRMNSYGQLEGKFGEYLGYGYAEGAALVAKMTIDEGATAKEHRQYVFDKDFLVVGIACGPHKTYKIMCVVDFAHSYREKSDDQ